MKRVWIVEMDFEDGRGWVPTVGSALTRDEARDEKCQWRKSNRGTKIRIKKYVRSDEP